MGAISLRRCSAPTSCSCRSAGPPGCAAPTGCWRTRCGGRARTSSVVAAAPQRELPTLALHELRWARAARAAAARGIAAHRPRTVLYSSSTAALLAPAPGAIRFDAPAAGNRPGRHGVWQRPVERRRFAQARLLVPWSEGGLAEAPRSGTPAIVVPVPVEPSGPSGARDIAAIAYGANPEKKGLDRVLAAWRQARRAGEELVVAGLDGAGEPGVRYAGMLAPGDYRALLRRARVFVTAPRREDYGIAQLEALADGCALVTTVGAGPYVALPLARAASTRGWWWQMRPRWAKRSARRSTTPRPDTPSAPESCSRRGRRPRSTRSSPSGYCRHCWGDPRRDATPTTCASEPA